jgi:hypothetical protein
MRRPGTQASLSNPRGQASVELIAVLPALIFCVLIATQLGLAGYSLWSAAAAARAGARAENVGADGAAAARRALPGILRQGAEIQTGPPLRARVRIPSVVPGVPMLSVSASTSLEARPDG